MINVKLDRKQFALLKKYHRLKIVEGSDIDGLLALARKKLMRVMLDMTNRTYRVSLTDLGWDVLSAHEGWDMLENDAQVLIEYRYGRLIRASDRHQLRKLHTDMLVKFIYWPDTLVLMAITTEKGESLIRCALETRDRVPAGPGYSANHDLAIDATDPENVKITIIP